MTHPASKYGIELKTLHSMKPHLLEKTTYSVELGRLSRTITVSPDAFRRVLSGLTTEELSKCCAVSQKWKSFIDSAYARILWRDASLSEGVPVVEGENRDYKSDFKFLRPITIGGRTMAQYLGEIVGELPRMDERCFSKLCSEQMCNNYVVVVDPAYLQITVGPERPFSLDTSNNLVIAPDKVRSEIRQQELIVPFTLKNLMTLTCFPLKRVSNGPVFDERCDTEVIEPCNAAPTRNSLLIMGKVAQAARLNTTEQAHKVNQHGFKAATVRQRAIHNAIRILKTGINPEQYWMIVRSPESVNANNNVVYPVLGEFGKDLGMSIYGDAGQAKPRVGFVPMLEAAARSKTA